MAFSIIEFTGKSSRVHDLDLSVACFLVIKQQEAKKSILLGKMFDDWIDSISFDGPGCIDLHLDEHLSGSESKALLKELLESTLRSLDEISGDYPKDELNHLLEKAKIHLESDYRVDLIRSTLIKLRTLIG